MWTRSPALRGTDTTPEPRTGTLRQVTRARLLCFNVVSLWWLVAPAPGDKNPGALLERPGPGGVEACPCLGLGRYG